MRRILVLLGVLIFIFPARINAEKEFDIGLDVTYRFDKEGTSLVEQIVTITNLTQFMYAGNYEMDLSGDSPSNLKASDSAGPMKIDEISNSKSTKINVIFNQPVVGLKKQYQFRLSYQGRRALHNGQVWEVVFPRLANADEIANYRLSVIIPKNFGKLAFSSPSPESNNGEVIVITSNQGAQYGVVAAFGDFQTYEFKLNYKINQSQNISLPADSGYQRVFYDSIDPKPENITVDPDGNWLAYYKLKDGEIKNIVAVGRVNILSDSTQSTSNPNYHDLTNYTKPTKYWPSDNNKFIQLAATYKTPKDIYKFVVRTLKYDRQKNPVRSGGLEALNTSDSALCSEFTDLFITMSRAAGIPAREQNGFAYTSNTDLRPLSLSGIDVLHAWPQYWDFARSAWISVDPTWEYTTRGIDYFSKMDFNHFAFVSHGISDSQPKSAGFYKLENDDKKSIEVKFGEFRDYSTKPLELLFVWPLQIWAPVGGRAKLLLTNPNPFAVYRTNVKLNGFDFENIDVIPPLSTRTIVYQIKPFWGLSFESKRFEFEAGGAKLTYNTSVGSYFIWHAGIAIFTSFIIIIVGFVASRIWSLYIQE